jgi:AAA15 family ATPase/GTPase
MIQSLSIKNYLSFKDEVVFSFEATKDKSLEESHTVKVAKGVRLNKIGIVYGYNASGKSNLIQAFQFLRDFWFTTVDDKDEDIDVIPFMLDDESRNHPSEFTLFFYHESVKYSYHLSAKGNIVLHEKLDFYPGVQPAVIFERTFKDGISSINFGKKIKISAIAKEEINIKCLKNISVLAAYSQVNVSINELDNVSHWMKEHVMPSIEPSTNLKEYTERLVNDNKDAKSYVLDYLSKADFNIVDIESNEFDRDIPDGFISMVKASGMPKKEIERIEKEKTFKMLDTSFHHSVVKNDIEEKRPLDIELQSDGTKRIFGLSGAIFETLKQDAFLTVDEIEAKLHPRLIEYVIEQFIRSSTQSQLLVTTHYDNLFDEDDLLRKDSFWFTEKGEDASTSLYPLTQFKGLKRISSLQKAYKFGKFGAVPNID